MSNDRRIAVALLNRASEAVGKIRGQQHGDAHDSFEHIGEMWTTYLRAIHKRLGIDLPIMSITAVDVARMMADVKRARSVWGDPSQIDNSVDELGYTSLAGMLGIPDAAVALALGQVADQQDDGIPVRQPDLGKLDEQMQDDHEPIPAFLRRAANEPVHEPEIEQGGDA